ncbi:MAG: DUF6622 family protein [Ahrensia sp.]|nr:DUF6622 family protein [Ahrensia sp.]
MNDIFLRPAADMQIDTDKTSMIAEIMTKTPIWVWPLLIALLFVGFMHTRNYSLPKPRIFILPITFTITALISIYFSAQPFISFGAIVLAAMLLTPLGLKIAERSGALINADNRLSVPGEWITILLICIMFSSRFIAGIVGGAAPSIASGSVFIAGIATISGAIVGIAFGRALGYLKLFAAKQTNRPRI